MSREVDGKGTESQGRTLRQESQLQTRSAQEERGRASGGGPWLLLGCGDQSRIRCLGLEPSLALALPPGREEEVVPPVEWRGG